MTMANGAANSATIQTHAGSRNQARRRSQPDAVLLGSQPAAVMERSSRRTDSSRGGLCSPAWYVPLLRGISATASSPLSRRVSTCTQLPRKTEPVTVAGRNGPPFDGSVREMRVTSGRRPTPSIQFTAPRKPATNACGGAGRRPAGCPPVRWRRRSSPPTDRTWRALLPDRG